MNHEETLLFTGGEDGLVMVWQVSDREGKILLNLILILNPSLPHFCTRRVKLIFKVYFAKILFFRTSQGFN